MCSFKVCGPFGILGNLAKLANIANLVLATFASEFLTHDGKATRLNNEL
jgi:hypothetical protein